MNGWIKVCGLTRPEDVELAVGAGANAIGLNIWARSPRSVSIDAAAELADGVRRRAEIVLVTVDLALEELKSAIAAIQPDWVQLHGSEPSSRITEVPVPAFKAFGLGTAQDAQRAMDALGERVLIDAKDDVRKGGTGKAPPDLLAARVCAARNTVLAGGLNPENVARAVTIFAPWGVDVASGVESSPGVKDGVLVRDFVQNARAAFEALGEKEDV